MHLHCDGKHVAGCCDGHAGGEHDLLAVAVQDAVIGIPGSRKGECDIDLLVGFSAFEKEKESWVWFTKVSEQQSLG